MFLKRLSMRLVLLLASVSVLVGNQHKALSQDVELADTKPIVASPKGRLVCPPDKEIDTSIKLIRAAYESAYDAAKDSGEPEPLIQQMIELAKQTNDSARKYALLLEAEAVATQYENYTTAIQLLEMRSAMFEIDGLKLKGQLLKRLAGAKTAADLVLFDQAFDTAEQAILAERFDVAAEAASLAMNIAKAVDREQKAEARKRARSGGKTARDGAGPAPIGVGLVKKAADMQTRTAAAHKLFIEHNEALSLIKANPENAAANSSVAKYLCFVRGEWQKGLPALAKSDLTDLRSIATEEMAIADGIKPDPSQIFQLAGKWWSAAESQGLPAEHESAIKNHAALFYADIVDDLPDALEKQLAKSRLAGRVLTVRPVTTRSVDKRAIGLVEMRVNKSVVGGETLRMGRLQDVQVNGKVPSSVILAHASSLVVFELPEQFEGTLQGSVALAGLTKANPSPGSCRFRILAGDDLLWESGVINQDQDTGGSVSERFNVALTGRRTISLEVDSLGANNSDRSVWVDPQLVWGGKGVNAADGVVGEKIIYLSDLPEIEPVVGCGEFGKGGQAGHWGWRVIVNNEYSPHGLSTHPDSKKDAGVSYDVPADAQVLVGVAAINDMIHDDGKPGRAKSPVSFMITADGGKVLWKSPRGITHSKEAMPFEVDVAGINRVRLVATCAGNAHNAAAVWVEPRFVVAPLRALRGVRFKKYVISPDGKRSTEDEIVEFGDKGVILWNGRESLNKWTQKGPSTLTFPIGDPEGEYHGIAELTLQSNGDLTGVNHGRPDGALWKWELVRQ